MEVPAADWSRACAELVAQRRGLRATILVDTADGVLRTIADGAELVEILPLEGGTGVSFRIAWRAPDGIRGVYHVPRAERLVFDEGTDAVRVETRGLAARIRLRKP